MSITSLIFVVWQQYLIVFRYPQSSPPRFKYDIQCWSTRALNGRRLHDELSPTQTADILHILVKYFDRGKRGKEVKTFGLNYQVWQDIWTGCREEKLLDLSWWHLLFKGEVGEDEDRKGRKKMRRWRRKRGDGDCTHYFNLLKMKHNLLYIRNQSVQQCQHFPPWS